MISKVTDVNCKIGQKINRWTIISENLHFNSDRKQLHVQCECGTKGFIRINHFKDSKSHMGCKSCVNNNNYPTQRKSSALFYNGLRVYILKKLKSKDNLIRTAKKDKIIEFNLTIEDLYNQLIKQNEKCALSGVPLKILYVYKKEDINGSIDRIDSKGGYTVDNIQWVHKRINRMKSFYSQEDFIAACNYVSKANPILMHDNSEPSWANS